MKILAVIPARIGSTRLKKKPLIKVKGKPILQYVYENVIKCEKLSKVIVATDSQEIVNCVNNFGGNVVLTDIKHENGSERVREVALNHSNFDIIVNVQGDEPMIDSEIIETLLLPFYSNNLQEVNISTLKTKITLLEANNPNIVKVITTLKGKAIYFSRAIIPYIRDKEDINKCSNNFYKHIGIYAYKRDFLVNTYNKMSISFLENVEKLEQLRILENGYSIDVKEITKELIDINTIEDVNKFEKILSK